MGKRRGTGGKWPPKVSANLCIEKEGRGSRSGRSAQVNRHQSPRSCALGWPLQDHIRCTSWCACREGRQGPQGCRRLTGAAARGGRWGTPASPHASARGTSGGRRGSRASRSAAPCCCSQCGPCKSRTPGGRCPRRSRCRAQLWARAGCSRSAGAETAGGGRRRPAMGEQGMKAGRHGRRRPARQQAPPAAPHAKGRPGD